MTLKNIPKPKNEKTFLANVKMICKSLNKKISKLHL